jgi:hypothetical protein
VERLAYDASSSLLPKPVRCRRRAARLPPPPRGGPQEAMSSRASSSGADVDVSASASLSTSSTALAHLPFPTASRKIATPWSTADSRLASAAYLHTRCGRKAGMSPSVCLQWKHQPSSARGHGRPCHARRRRADVLLTVRSRSRYMRLRRRGRRRPAGTRTASRWPS